MAIRKSKIKRKKRIINREMKQVEEKILLDISDSQFKKKETNEYGRAR